MAAPIDLSTLKKSDTPAFDSLSPEDQEALSKIAEEKGEPEGTRVRTAFLVLVDDDGQAVAVPDLDVKIIRERIPTTDDMFAALSLIQKDIQVQEAAQVTVSFMQQMAAVQAQRMQEQRLVQGLNL